MAETFNPATTNQAPVTIETAGLDPIYANFCRVTGTPEELIIDFGLTGQPADVGGTTVKASERVILSFYTSKRLLEALHMTIARHEAAFGPLELNVEKRVLPGWTG